jgi:superfamily II DNA or RNA helicase
MPVNPNQTNLDFITTIRVEEPVAIDLKIWPEQFHYPINLPSSSGFRRRVHEVIADDVTASSQYLIITGFTSLNHLIFFLSEKVDWEKMDTIRISLGWEPRGKTKKKWAPFEVGREVKDYWLDRGLWIDQGGAVLRLSELINQDRVLVRYYSHQHAKIYVGDQHIILGSANFSGQGTTTQREANIRIAKGDEYHHPTYDNLQLIAENYYQEAECYKEGLLELLSKLMSVVSWEVALARAIAVLLGTQALDDLPDCQAKIKAMNLWPLQNQGLGMSLSLLQNKHCALVADPTGSGKTRMISAIQAALLYSLTYQGYSPDTKVLVICPPAVEESWREELNKLGVYSKSASNGVISQEKAFRHKETIEDLKNARILILDEAHNYLRPGSQRSQRLAQHRADFVLLATATPINRTALDLLRMLEMMNPDNLEDQDLKQFREIFEQAKRGFKVENKREVLASFIQPFLIRRTKPWIRDEIKKNKSAYRNKQGQECTYPDLDQQVYTTSESAKDQRIALLIEELASKLTGVLSLRFFELHKHSKIPPAKYVDLRVKTAPYLVRYQLLSCLRSSSFALREHLIGTKAVLDELKWKDFKGNHTGNVIGRLEKASKTLPTLAKQFPRNAFTGTHSWLINPLEYSQKAAEESSIYRQILTLSEQLSDKREEGKAKLLANLLKKHSLLLAFDTTVSTLYYLQNKYLSAWNVDTRLLIGGKIKPGSTDEFGLNSKAEQLIGLCSDAVSEGVNMQKASALVFLTIPGVIRLAEQRIGRIERLDSPHKKVKVFWPRDSDAFALQTDKKLFKAAEDVTLTIGSNFILPEELLMHTNGELKFERYSTDQAKAELLAYRNKEADWDGLEDAFSPVRNFLEGEPPFVSRQTFNDVKDTKATIKVRIGLVPSEKPWVFMATQGKPNRPPRWLLFEEKTKPETDLKIICHKLQEKLKGQSVETVKWNKGADVLLKQYQQKFENLRLELLPIKRKRAILVGELLLRREAKKTDDKSKEKLLYDLAAMSGRHYIEEDVYVIDLFQLSQAWLDILQPRLLKYRKQRKSRVLTTLMDLKSDKNIEPFTEDELKHLANQVMEPMGNPLDLAACILGVPSELEHPEATVS